VPKFAKKPKRRDWTVATAVKPKQEEKGTATVYVGGKKLEGVPAGTLAGEFMPTDIQADLVVRNGTIKQVEKSYKLQDKDDLVVTPRGVAG